MFGSSSKGDLQKGISGIDIGSGGKGGKGFKGGSSWEDGLLDAIGSGVIGAEAAWPLLKGRVLGLFEGEALKNTVEDLNKLVVYVLQLSACLALPLLANIPYNI